MRSRRRFLAIAAAAAAAGLRPSLALGDTSAAAAPEAGPLLTRPIPASGEMLPVIGMGTSGSFDRPADERDALREVLRRFLAAGARVIDTAPVYGEAEAAVGALVAELGARAKVFLATKISITGREAGLAQFRRSLADLRTDAVDLLQVHSLRDWQTQLPLIRALKAEGKTRYVGVTHSSNGAHDDLAAVIESERPDFLQVNYSVAEPAAQDRLLPLARDLGVAVIVNRAFLDGALFERVDGKALPPWAADFGIGSWAQLFLKFALSHPAVTVVIPATGKPDRQSDNLRAGVGPMLPPAQCAELVQIFA